MNTEHTLVTIGFLLSGPNEKLRSAEDDFGPILWKLSEGILLHKAKFDGVKTQLQAISFLQNPMQVEGVCVCSKCTRLCTKPSMPNTLGLALGFDSGDNAVVCQECYDKPNP